METKHAVNEVLAGHLRVLNYVDGNMPDYGAAANDTRSDSADKCREFAALGRANAAALLNYFSAIAVDMSMLDQASEVVLMPDGSIDASCQIDLFTLMCRV